MFIVFVGITSALLCHTRFRAVENSSKYWFLWISFLLGQDGGFMIPVQATLCNELILHIEIGS